MHVKRTGAIWDNIHPLGIGVDSEPTRNLDIIDEQHIISFGTKAKVLKHWQESVLHCLKICWLPQQVHGF